MLCLILQNLPNPMDLFDRQIRLSVITPGIAFGQVNAILGSVFRTDRKLRHAVANFVWIVLQIDQNRRQTHRIAAREGIILSVQKSGRGVCPDRSFFYNSYCFGVTDLSIGITRQLL